MGEVNSIRIKRIYFEYSNLKKNLVNDLKSLLQYIYNLVKYIIDKIQQKY